MLFIKIKQIINYLIHARYYKEKSWTNSTSSLNTSQSKYDSSLIFLKKVLRNSFKKIALINSYQVIIFSRNIIYLKEIRSTLKVDFHRYFPRFTPGKDHYRIFFSTKLYGKVSVISWLLFHLI